MSSREVPNVILLQDYEDANMVVAGVLSLKGCKVYKSTNGDDCLSIMNQLGDNVDVILMKKEIALNMNSMILKSIKKINPGAIILILADDTIEEDRLRDHQIDEFVQTPISAENLADKILMLIAKKELKRIKENQSRNL